MVKNRSRLPAWRMAVAVGVVSLGASISYSGDGPGDAWTAPPRAARKPNPVPADAAAISAGKKVYASNCMACHGAGGKGDGPAAVALTPKPRDLSNPAIQGQTDGSMFWKITEGKKPMPSFEKLIAENDRWNVIHYVRTFAAGSTP